MNEQGMANPPEIPQRGRYGRTRPGSDEMALCRVLGINAAQLWWLLVTVAPRTKQ